MQGTNEMLQDKTLMSRKLQDKFSRTLSRHFQTISRHNSKKRYRRMSRHNSRKRYRRVSRHNIASQDKKLEDKQNNVVTKMPFGPDF